MRSNLAQQMRDDFERMRDDFERVGLDPDRVAESAVRALLAAIGEDPDRAGLRDTPGRVVRMLTAQMRTEPFDFTMFDAEGANEMIVQAPVPFSSFCEHHIVPFVGVAAVAYIPDRRIVGLSKLARAVQAMSAGLQNQERITTRVAALLEEKLQPQGVGVVLRARHLCMEVRGVKAPGAWTVTSALRGALKENPETRDEFLRLAEAAWR